MPFNPYLRGYLFHFCFSKVGFDGASTRDLTFFIKTEPDPQPKDDKGLAKEVADLDGNKSKKILYSMLKFQLQAFCSS